MAPRIGLLFCEHYLREVESVLASEAFPDAVVGAFPARCGRSPLSEAAVRDAMASLGEVDRVEIFGAACCLAGIGGGTSEGGCRVHRQAQCFDTIADDEVIGRCLREGAYLVTPGWLARWPEALSRLGLTDETARALFAETTTRVVLLDTGIDPAASQEKLRAFAGAVGRPCETLPVGLSRLRLLVTKTLLSWRLEREAQNCQLRVREIRKQSADYALAVDLLGGISRITQEGEAVEAILDFFTMLFAPGRLAYLSIGEDGRPGRLWLRPPAQDEAEQEAVRQRLAAFRETSGSTASGTGFLLRILHREQAQGVIEADRIAFPEYRDHYRNLALNIVNVCALPIENARKYEQLRQTEHLLQQANEELFRLATTDALTGIANRRAFDEHLDREWRRMARERAPLAMILADIDYFKNYNDRYGHQAGDACLRAVARALGGRGERPGDFIARYGGEEFVLLLPQTDARGAMHVAEAIRQAVRALAIPHADSRVGDTVSLSLGVAATTPVPRVPPEALLQAADAALYTAKSRGRDRVIFGGDLPLEGTAPPGPEGEGVGR